MNTISHNLASHLAEYLTVHNIRNDRINELMDCDMVLNAIQDLINNELFWSKDDDEPETVAFKGDGILYNGHVFTLTDGVLSVRKAPLAVEVVS
jgi:hypothetical protein